MIGALQIALATLKTTALVVIFAPSIAFAQSARTPVQQVAQVPLVQHAPTPSQVTPRELAPPPAFLSPSAASTPRIAPPPPSGRAPLGAETLTVTPSHITVEDGLEALAGAEAAATAPLAGRTITVAELYTAADRIEAAYARAGYVLVRVVVPAQELNDGAPARLTVINGFIERIDVSALPVRLRTPVAAALAQLVDRPWITLALIERRLMIVSDLPGTGLRSTLSAGERVGGAILSLDGALQVVDGAISYDNRVSDAFDGRQFNLQFALNSAMGFGEQVYGFVSADLGLGLERAFGADAPRRVFGAGFALPFNGAGTRLTFEATQSLTQPRSGFFITRGAFTRGSVRLAHPVIRDRSRTLLLTGMVETLEERQEAPQFGILLSRDRYVVGRLSTDYNAQTFLGFVAMSATLTSGWGEEPTDAPLSRAAATTRFTKIEAQLRGTVPLHAGLDLTGVFKSQAVLDGGVPSTEVFVLEGPDALSPFTAGSLITDGGFVARIAITRPDVGRSGGLAVTPGVYASGGWGHFQQPTPFDVERAAAVGATLDIAARLEGTAAWFAMTFDYGRRLLEDFSDTDHLTLTLALRF